MSAFARGDRVRYWGGARPGGIAGEVVVVDWAGHPGMYVVNAAGTELIAYERDLTAVTTSASGVVTTGIPAEMDPLGAADEDDYLRRLIALGLVVDD